jgi:DNA gyrase subunit A
MIMGLKGINDAYTTGRGLVTVRGKAHIEQTKKGKPFIIISEIPYQVNKTRLIERIAQSVREKR